MKWKHKSNPDLTRHRSPQSAVRCCVRLVTGSLLVKASFLDPAGRERKRRVYYWPPWCSACRTCSCVGLILNTKTYGGSGRTGPRVLNPITNLSWVISFTSEEIAPPAPFGYEVGWAPDLIWTMWGWENLVFIGTQIQTLLPSSPQPNLVACFHDYYLEIYSTFGMDNLRPPLWSSGQSSWLQIRRPGLDSRHCQKKKWVWNGVHSASWVQLRRYLIEK
jgi:hypothetical protein